MNVVLPHIKAVVCPFLSLMIFKSGTEPETLSGENFKRFFQYYSVD